MQEKEFDITKVTYLYETRDIHVANSLISQGWVLLRISTSSIEYEPVAAAWDCFVLGWTGDPDEAVDMLPPDTSIPEIAEW